MRGEKEKEVIIPGTNFEKRIKKYSPFVLNIITKKGGLFGIYLSNRKFNGNDFFYLYPDQVRILLRELKKIKIK